MTTRLIITRPDDWHVHFRDGALLNNTVPATAHHFLRALVMPNLTPALTSLSALLAYRERILAALPAKSVFEPYMTLYLNQSVTQETLRTLKQYPFILGAKLYPAGVTTNSQEGVISLQKLYPLFDTMQTCGLVLQVHGETPHGDIFEREMRFIDQELIPLSTHFPQLKIVFEHISTQAAVDFVQQSPATIAATITPQHLMFNRNHLLAGGIKPHYYCMPLLKHERDQQALQAAAISGNPKFFAGTDSAPHARSQKENACGCAGVFSASYAVACYAEVFDQAQALDKLEAFLSHFGADFYALPRNNSQLHLIKQPQFIPASLTFGIQEVVPIAAQTSLQWSIDDTL